MTWCHLHLRNVHWSYKKNLKSYNFLSKFTSLHWASVIAVPGYMCSQSVKIEKQACLYHRIIGRARGIVMLTGLRTMTQLLLYVPFCSWPAFFPLPIPQGVSLSVLSPRKIPLLHWKHCIHRVQNLSMFYLNRYLTAPVPNLHTKMAHKQIITVQDEMF